METSASNSNIWLPYTQMQTVAAPLTAIKTNGSLITLEDGTELLDGIASWWTAAHGYNHPHIVAALQQQAQEMPHIMLGGLVHPQAQKLASRLAEITPGNLKHVFFSDSGSVAVEVALKMALQFWINQGYASKKKFISFQYGYHGDTAGCMAVCDPKEGMHALFKDYVAANYNLQLPKSQAELEIFAQFLTKHKNEIAAVIIEPLVQGAGGMKMHSAAELKSIFNICKQHDLLFITDEIFTGFGRTGNMFACDKAEIVPDIMCVSKALTGGVLPLAATIATTDVFQAFLGEDAGKALMHGPTFMGNAMACAAANAALDLFATEPRLQQVAAIEEQFSESLLELETIKNVKQVRIKGAIAAIELHHIDIAWFKKYFISQGVWLRPFGNIVYSTPAFTIEPHQLQRIIKVMQQAIIEFQE